jgi:large subunit ribosomal protein L2
MSLSIYIKYHFQRILKNSSICLSSSGGRNFLGRICVYHKGAGNKNLFRRLDFYRRLNQLGFLLKVFKDSFRTGYLGLVLYETGVSSFVLLTEGLFVGSTIFSGFELNFQKKLLDLNGSTSLLKNVGLFSNISSIELFPLSGAKIARAAGAGALIISKDFNKVSLKLVSG